MEVHEHAVRQAEHANPAAVAIDERQPTEKMRLSELRIIGKPHRKLIERALRSKGYGGTSRDKEISAYDTAPKGDFLQALQSVSSMDPNDLALIQSREKLSVEVSEEEIAAQRAEYENMKMFEVRALAKQLGIKAEMTTKKDALLAEIYKVLEG